jgi:hypothetical protein
MQPTYYNPPNTSDFLSSTLDTPTARQGFVIVSSGLHIVSIVAIIFIIRKLHSYYMLLALQRPSVHAFTITLRPPLPSVSPSTLAMPSYQSLLLFASFALLTIILLKLTVCLLRFRCCHLPKLHTTFRRIFGPNQHLYKARVYLKLLSAQDQGFILYLCSIPQEINLAEWITSPTITSLNIHGTCFFTVHVTWSAPLLIAIHGTIYSIDLPEMIPIPITLIWTVKNLTGHTSTDKLISTLLLRFRASDTYEELVSRPGDQVKQGITACPATKQNRPGVALYPKTILSQPKYCPRPTFNLHGTRPSAPFQPINKNPLETDHLLCSSPHRPMVTSAAVAGTEQTSAGTSALQQADT